MKKLCIYEPALCCDTGLCGVSVDPELLRITTVLNTLKEKGVEVGRYNLNNAPMEFVKSSTVNQYVNDKGVEGLPCATLDGEIVIFGRYPSNEEILTLLELPAEYLLPEGATEVKESCCCGDGAEAKACCAPTESESQSDGEIGCCCGSGCC